MIADVTSKSLAELLSLKDRTAVVTGGAAGIGLATARRFAEAGANVVVADLNEEAGQKAVDQLKAYGGNPSFVRLDVSDVDSIGQAADYLMKRYGALHVWANIAGIFPLIDTMSITPAQWDKVQNVNLRGTFFASREAARCMMAQESGGVILNTHATSAYKVPAGGLAHYVASKGGIETVTRALALEFGPRNVRVLAVAPTMTETEGTAADKPALDLATGGVDIQAIFAARLPLRRLGCADDVARVFLMLASDLSLFVTGSVIPVDGGDLTF